MNNNLDQFIITCESNIIDVADEGFMDGIAKKLGKQENETWIQYLVRRIKQLIAFINQKWNDILSKIKNKIKKDAIDDKEKAHVNNVHIETTDFTPKDRPKNLIDAAMVINACNSLLKQCDGDIKYSLKNIKKLITDYKQNHDINALKDASHDMYTSVDDMKTFYEHQVPYWYKTLDAISSNEKQVSRKGKMLIMDAINDSIKRVTAMKNDVYRELDNAPNYLNTILNPIVAEEDADKPTIVNLMLSNYTYVANECLFVLNKLSTLTTRINEMEVIDY